MEKVILILLKQSTQEMQHKKTCEKKSVMHAHKSLSMISLIYSFLFDEV